MSTSISEDDELSPRCARRWASSAAEACSSRGLVRSAAWLAELALCLRHVPSAGPSVKLDPDLPEDERELYLAAKSYLDCREFLRAASVAEAGRSPKVRFLHLYARYLAEENGRLDDAAEAGREPPDARGPALRLLYDTMKREFSDDPNKVDGYWMYLYGIVLKKLDLTSQAVRALERAVSLAPWIWGAWLELSSLPRDRDELESLTLPRHLLAAFFRAHARLERQRAEEALDLYEKLKSRGYEKFSYLNAQIAVAYHDLRDADNTIAAFESLRKTDPYRLDDLDVYSHILYVKEMRTELANLAHQVVEIDKYRVETCCIIANYYSLRSEHHKAVVYFQRALKLNPGYLSAWILMGHEFIELQNMNAAIQSYRQALEVNRNDYRAWNGLGQAYEILGLNGYCLYYYTRAAQQCPDDSRMLVALGEAFEKLDKVPNALKCYHRAYSVNDVEGMAVLKLAKLYDKLSMRDSAAAAYSAACLSGDAGVHKRLQEAYRYLAHYHLNDNKLDQAAHYAYKCMGHEETKEEGKSLLKMIAERRADAHDDPREAGESTPKPTGPPFFNISG